MTSPILVTGGTATLGRHVVRRLRGAGCDVRVLSRRSHEAKDGIRFVTGDLVTGEGIEAAGANAADGGEPRRGRTKAPRGR
jgi:nucleoside-diphosphate-sugar epimerase